MSLSPQEAAAALHDIEQTERRSLRLRRYRHGSPHLILWGVLWAVGYGLTGVWPAHAPIIWTIVVPAGILGGFAILRLTRSASEPASSWRYAAISSVLIGFFFATFFVMSPVNGRQVGAFIPMFIAAAYMLTGLWFGLRYVVAGIAIAALTLAGFAFLGHYFALWMAGVGGGALILAGFWLRQV